MDEEKFQVLSNRNMLLSVFTSISFLLMSQLSRDFIIELVRRFGVEGVLSLIFIIGLFTTIVSLSVYLSVYSIIRYVKWKKGGLVKPITSLLLLAFSIYMMVRG